MRTLSYSLPTRMTCYGVPTRMTSYSLPTCVTSYSVPANMKRIPAHLIIQCIFTRTTSRSTVTVPFHEVSIEQRHRRERLLAGANRHRHDHPHACTL